MNVAVIFIGLSGSGKTTAANRFMSDLEKRGIRYAYHSTDDFFKRLGRFEGNLVPVFHAKNQAAFRESCRKKIPVVICDNTNINFQEREPYVKAARENGYSIEYRVIGNPKDKAHIEECKNRNVHNVPSHIVERQSSKFQAP